MDCSLVSDKSVFDRFMEPCSLYLSKTAFASIFPSRNFNHVSLIYFIIFKIYYQPIISPTYQRIRSWHLKTILASFEIVSNIVSQHTERCWARFTSGLKMPFLKNSWIPPPDRFSPSANQKLTFGYPAQIISMLNILTWKTLKSQKISDSAESYELDI